MRTFHLRDYVISYLLFFFRMKGNIKLQCGLLPQSRYATRRYDLFQAKYSPANERNVSLLKQHGRATGSVQKKAK